VLLQLQQVPQALQVVLQVEQLAVQPEQQVELLGELPVDRELQEVELRLGGSRALMMVAMTQT
jgi:hypothetical protein